MRLQVELDEAKTAAADTQAALQAELTSTALALQEQRQLAAASADLREQLRLAKADLEAARRGDDTWEIVSRLQKDIEFAKERGRAAFLNEEEASDVRPLGLREHVEKFLTKFQEVTSLLEKTRQALRQATEAMEKSGHANRVERQLLASSALSSLKQLSVHLTYTLSGLRVGEERPFGQHAADLHASLLAIKAMPTSQSLPALPTVGGGTVVGGGSGGGGSSRGGGVDSPASARKHPAAKAAEKTRWAAAEGPIYRSDATLLQGSRRRSSPDVPAPHSQSQRNLLYGRESSRARDFLEQVGCF